jgi:hypothetical protein
MPSCTLAIGHTLTTALFGTDSARPADNHTVIIEFRVDDVDSEYERLKFRDPGGNLVNLFTPVTQEAITKFSR